MGETGQFSLELARCSTAFPTLINFISLSKKNNNNFMGETVYVEAHLYGTVRLLYTATEAVHDAVVVWEVEVA